MNIFLRKKPVSNCSVPFLILVSVAAAITGCQGVDLGSTTFGQSLISCDESLKAFTPTGAVRTNIGPGELAAGVYTHTSSEVFVSSGNVRDKTLSRIHYMMVPSSIKAPQTNSTADLNKTSIALRCRESSLNFNPISDSISIPTAITHLKNGNIIDASRIFNISFQKQDTSSLYVSDGGTTAQTDAGSYSYGLGRYWGTNSFAVRSGNTYEFYGVRQLSNDYVIYGKAVYIRTDLPANSQ